MMTKYYRKYGLLEETNKMRQMMGLTSLMERTKVNVKGQGNIVVDPRGDKDWVLKVPKKYQFDRDNITVDSPIFQAIKGEIGANYPNLKPEQLQLSVRGKTGGTGKDKYIVMITGDNVTEEEKDKIKSVATEVLKQLPTKDVASTVVKPTEDVASTVVKPTEDVASTEVKVYKLTKTGKYEYTLKGGEWFARNTGTKKWSIDLTTNQEASARLDKKFPNAREKQTTFSEEKPDNIKHFQEYANSQGESLKTDNIWGPNTKKAWNKHKGTYKPDDAAASKTITVTKDKGVLFDLDGKKVSYEVFSKEMDRRAKAYEEKTDEFVEFDLDGKKVPYEVWSKEMDRRAAAFKAKPTGAAAGKIQKAVEDNKDVPFVPNWGVIHPWKI